MPPDTYTARQFRLGVNMANKIKNAIEQVIKEVHCLEEFMVECAEMTHFTAGINRLVMKKNEAYLKEKEAEREKALIDFTSCDMFRYLSAT